MSKVRINDLAKELEVKSRAILDVLQELGVSAGKTHSSSLEGDEAEKVRAHFSAGSRSASHAAARVSRHGAPTIVPKIDLSHISKPGDVMKAILAKKKEEEEEARHARMPAKPAAPPAQPQPSPRQRPRSAAAAAARLQPQLPARPEPRKIVPQPRQAPPIIAQPPALSGHCQPSSVRRCCGQAARRRGSGRAPGGCGCAASGAAWSSRPRLPAAREEKPAVAKPACGS